jgi:serine/threonine protein kinase
MVEDSGDTSDMITRSFCGTEQYMSPEMLLQQGHNYRMDWWCLGLLMHEMISAKHPFHGASHYDTLRNMVTKQPNIDGRLTKEAVLVVRSFLIKVPRARLCCTTGINELKDLAYFNGLDWVALQEKRIEMPYKPALKDSVDITSFETVFTREAPVDSVSDANSSEKSKGGKGILGTIFGIGKTDANAVAAPDQDAFKDFAFAKDEDLDGIVKSD